jgi:hypothetical protein
LSVAVRVSGFVRNPGVHRQIPPPRGHKFIAGEKLGTVGRSLTGNQKQGGDLVFYLFVKRLPRGSFNGQSGMVPRRRHIDLRDVDPWDFGVIDLNGNDLGGRRNGNLGRRR